VQRRGGDEDVDAGRLAAPERLGGAGDVAVVGAGERADPRAADGAGDRPDRLEVAVGEAAKPASITSTRSRSSCRAMRSFSSFVMEAPGDCSPSRSVVSKMNRRSVTARIPQK
jgi:hypothetical protein